MGAARLVARGLRPACRGGAPVRRVWLAAGVGAFPSADRRQPDQRRQALPRLAAAQGSAQLTATARRDIVPLAVSGSTARPARALGEGTRGFCVVAAPPRGAPRLPA